MDIKQEYREEKNKDVYAKTNGKGGLEKQRTGVFSTEYVLWLESKVKNNVVLDGVSKCNNCSEEETTMYCKKCYNEAWEINPC